MAVLQTILSLFAPAAPSEPEIVVPALPTTYEVHTLTRSSIDELMRLNARCFRNGENYTKHTFSYLLGEPATLSYLIATAAGEMAGFVFVMLTKEGTGHLTTIGVAPEHRRRGLARRLMMHLEPVLRAKGISAIVLEVRVGNTGAQALYRQMGYSVVQRVTGYYHNGEDGYLMMKSIV